MSSSLTFKKEKNNFLQRISNLFSSNFISKNVYKKYDVSAEEIIEFEKWCALQ